MERSPVFDDDEMLELQKYLKKSVSSTDEKGLISKLHKLNQVFWDLKQYALLSGESAEKLNEFLNVTVFLEKQMEEKLVDISFTFRDFLTELDDKDGELY